MNVVSVCLLAPNWWLSRMAEMSAGQQKAPNTHIIHGSLVAVSIFAMTLSSFSFYHLLLKAAENPHSKMTLAIIKAPVKWLYPSWTYPESVFQRYWFNGRRTAPAVFTSSYLLPVLPERYFGTCCNKLLAISGSSSNNWHICLLRPLLSKVLQRAEENWSHQMQSCVLTRHRNSEWTGNSAHFKHEQDVRGQTKTVCFNVALKFVWRFIDFGQLDTHITTV